MSLPHGHNKATRNQEGWVVTESIFQSAKNAKGVTLNPQAFSDLIEQQGVNVRVYRTLYCPNVKSVDGGEHNIDCTRCNGSGWVDYEPLCVKATIQSIALDKLSKVEGLIDGNTVLMTFPTGVELQYFTLVELVDFTEIFMQRVLRAPGTDVDILKYGACRVNVTVDLNDVRYYQDQDFKINDDGDLLWLPTPAANRPADNLPYSIHYEARLQFRAVRAAHVNRLAQHRIGSNVEYVKFPENWFLAKEFLLRRKDVNGMELKQGPFDNHTIVT